MNITKREFIDQLHTEYGYTKGSAEQLVNDFCELVINNIEEGNTVSIYGFECFDVVKRKGRTCKSPQGDETYVPEHWSPKFYPGNALRRAVKIWSDNEERGL